MKAYSATKNAIEVRWGGHFPAAVASASGSFASVQNLPTLGEAPQRICEEKNSRYLGRMGMRKLPAGPRKERYSCLRAEFLM